MTATKPHSTPLAGPLFKTPKGRLYLGNCEDVLKSRAGSRLKGRVNLIFTSPPFPLNKKKRYGNLQGDAYLEWLKQFGPSFADLLTETGSIVMEIGNAWEPGRPIQSVLPYKSLLGFLEAGKLNLCQEVTYYNPARLPGPAQWVNVERIRLKDATTKVWWMSKTDRPRADNRNVLRPYSESMLGLLQAGKYNSGKRPSQHKIGAASFLKDNKGAIASNLFQEANTFSNSPYQRFCRENDVAPHPARMPEKIVEFFIQFLTKKGDLVLDPFAGSNTTGAVAQRLDRKWVSIEPNPEYAAASVSRFDTHAASKMLKDLSRKSK
jgi:site-specific DNA-methyltransferase (cytosine-N4-specific)